MWVQIIYAMPHVTFYFFPMSPCHFLFFPMSLSTVFFIKGHVGFLQLLKWPCFTHVEPSTCIYNDPPLSNSDLILVIIYIYPSVPLFPFRRDPTCNAYTAYTTESNLQSVIWPRVVESQLRIPVSLTPPPAPPPVLPPPIYVYIYLYIGLHVGLCKGPIWWT